MTRLLIDHLPPRFNNGNAREVEEVQRATQPELDAVWVYSERILTESNLDTMTEYGIARWEAILGILPPSYFSLEERRFEVKSRLGAQLPYTDFRVREILNSLVGEDVYILTRYLEQGEQVLHIVLRMANSNLYGVIYDMLDRIVSAELLIALEVDWNRWADYRARTWESVTVLTWKEMREKEME